VNSFLDTLKQLGPARLAIMGGVVVGLLIFFIFVSMRISSPDMKLLYDNLTTADSGAMAAKLEEAKLKYDVSPDGSRIMVPGDEVGKARMLLAADGLPNGGTMGYEIFDQQNGFGTTNFVQNINQVRALEGELARTIGAVQGVRSARVHLVLPQREMFSRDSRQASASVFLALKSSMPLEAQQIAAIQSLVASAVPGLKPNGVSIIDNNGNLLARGGEDDATMLSLKSEEMRRNYESRTGHAIEDMVGRIVGYGHVRAQVTADLNFDRVSTNEEIYDPNGQVVRSTQTTQDSNTERESQNSGDVSVQNNLPGIAGAAAENAPTTQGAHNEETTNYEISKTVRQSVSDIGQVKKMSVAVLVDGTYTTDKDGKKTYQPRSDDEINRITALVKSAIGFDEKRGDTIDVANLQFADVDASDATVDSNLLFGFERKDLLDAAEIIVVAIMVILVILLIIQPMVGRLLATEGPAMEEGMATGLLAGRTAAPALTGPSISSENAFQPGSVDEDADNNLINMQSVEGKVKASAVKKVEDIVETYPNETVSVLRSWMSQES
jgi:flagellar M-ring protein FliF